MVELLEKREEDDSSQDVSEAANRVHHAMLYQDRSIYKDVAQFSELKNQEHNQECN